MSTEKSERILADVNACLELLASAEPVKVVSVDDGSVTVTSPYNSDCCDSFIVFEGAEIAGALKPGAIYYAEIPGDGELILYGEDNEDSEEGASLSYASARAYVYRYRPTHRQGMLYARRHAALLYGGAGIRSLAEIAPDALNQTEKELLPVISDISALVFQEPPGEEGFSALRGMLAAKGHAKAVKLHDKYVKAALKFHRRRAAGIRNRLIFELARPVYEEFFREIYDRIEESQRDYPAREPDAGIRETVDRVMAKCGYIGNWPEYRAERTVKGPRLVERDAVKFFVGRRKLCSSVYAEELDYGGTPSMLCLSCGTVYLREEDPVPKDAVSYLFTDGGDRMNVIRGPVTDKEDAEKYATVAAKVAADEKLGPDERKIFNPVSSLTLFAVFFIALAVASALIYFIMIGVSSLILLIATGSSGFGEMFSSTYPLLICIFCLPMLVAVIALVSRLMTKRY